MRALLDFVLEVNIIGKYVEFKYCECGCGKSRSKYDRDGNEVKYIAYHKVRNDQFGERNSHYKNGSRIANGYRWVLVRDHPFSCDGYIREHRYLFEQYHQCCLLKWAEIHHINGNKLDNRKENLEGMMDYRHNSIHHKKDMSNRFCLICKSKETYVYSTGRTSWYKYNDGFVCVYCWRKRRKS